MFPFQCRALKKKTSQPCPWGPGGFLPGLSLQGMTRSLTVVTLQYKMPVGLRARQPLSLRTFRFCRLLFYLQTVGMTHRSSWVVKSLRNRKYGPVRLLTCKVCFQACQLTCSLELASVRFECSHRLVLLGGHISGRNALVYIVYLACFRSQHKPSSSFKQ